VFRTGVTRRCRSRRDKALSRLIPLAALPPLRRIACVPACLRACSAAASQPLHLAIAASHARPGSFPEATTHWAPGWEFEDPARGRNNSGRPRYPDAMWPLLRRGRTRELDSFPCWPNSTDDPHLSLTRRPHPAAAASLHLPLKWRWLLRQWWCVRIRGQHAICSFFLGARAAHQAAGRCTFCVLVRRSAARIAKGTVWHSDGARSTGDLPDSPCRMRLELGKPFGYVDHTHTLTQRCCTQGQMVAHSGAWTHGLMFPFWLQPMQQCVR